MLVYNKIVVPGLTKDADPENMSYLAKTCLFLQKQRVSHPGLHPRKIYLGLQCAFSLEVMVIFQVKMKIGEDYNILQIFPAVFIQNGGQQLSIP